MIMRKPFILLLLTLVSATTNAKASNRSFSGITIIERNNNGVIKSVKYASTDKNIPLNAKEFFDKTLNKRHTDEFIIDQSKKSINGMAFERYQQYYHGVKVAEGHYNFRYQNDKMKVAKGHYVDVTNINPVPSITENDAVKAYASFLGININSIVKKHVSLIISEGPEKPFNKVIDKAKLVFQVFLIADGVDETDLGFVDAHSGKVLYTKKSCMHSSYDGQFYTYYNRNVNDVPKLGKTDYNSDSLKYYLWDTTRGDGIYTHKKMNPSSEFTDLDNIWNRWELGNYNIGLDVHWTMEKIHEWMNYFGYDSYDGQGGKIECFITDNSNATYIFPINYFIFGNSIGTLNMNPYGTVDVIGHEFGHAILYNSTHLSNITGSVGAIHEGLADIWGIIFETHITPNADIWKIGEDITLDKSCLRNFQYPGDSSANTQMASTYGVGLGTSSDKYILSGLLSHWFYLLSQGGSGNNENLDNYQLLPVGVDLAEQLIIYTTLTSAYLEDCTTFQDIREGFYDAALDMGYNYLAEQVQNAWYAVGLDVEPNHIYGPLFVRGSGSYYVDCPPYSLINWSFTNTGYGPSPTIVPNSGNYSCTITTSSYFTGILNATIYCDGKTASYSINISGAANVSSYDSDIIQIVPVDGTHYQLSIASRPDGENKNSYIKVYDAHSLRIKAKSIIGNENLLFDTSSWKRGLYVIELTIGNDTYSKKLLIK